jgi:thioesterase domain-containing protein/acyl carrier protein
MTVEAIYPLSPSQQGMLFETLGSGRPGIHVEQALFVLTSELDVARFAAAWQAVVDRHAILRTAFVWRGRPEPLQVALRHAPVPLAVHDWRARPPGEHDAAFAAYLADDRRAGFAPERAPLLRIALFRTGERSHRLVVTFHHVVMDGWSLAVVLSEALASYEGAPLPLPAAYQAFIRWQRARDPVATEAYWRTTLAGFRCPTRWGVEDPSATPDAGYDELEVQVAPELGAGLRALAEAHRVTPSTVIQGLWGVLLARYSGERDVVFGITVSGRPAELPGVLAMVGLFINTVPLRLQLPGDGRWWPWLAALQLRSAAGRAFEHSAGGQIQRWSELPATRPLYDTVVVYENYPEDRTGLAGASLNVDLDRAQTIGAQTAYPVTLLVGARRALSLKLITRRDRIAGREAAVILTHLQALIARLVAEPACSIDQLLATIAPAAAPRICLAPVRAAAPAASPRDAVELQLQAIWRDVLGRDEIGVHDNFFELGGHSLLALELVGRIEQRFGVSLPLAALLDRPTIERVASAIRGAPHGGGASPAIYLGSGAAPRGPLAAAVFCVPGAAMDTISLQPLARALGDDPPVYGLQPRGLDGGIAPPATVEDAAADNVAALRAIQPVGPYYLVGHSYGAHVAYEMTQQLCATGADVALLAVLDARARTGVAAGATARDDEARLGRLMSLIRRFFGRDLALPVERLRGLAPDAQIEQLAAALAAAGVLPVELGAHRLGRYLRVGEVTAAALERYAAAGRYPVPTLVIRARDTHADDDALGDPAGGADDDALGWRALAAGDAAVHWVDGDHVTMITRPHAGAIADVVRRALRGRAEAA